MKIIKDIITTLPKQGYITLQIPGVAVTLDGSPLPGSEDLPDEWFTELKDGRRPAVGKEWGFLYLTRKGWEANRHRIKRDFTPNRGTWEDFEAYVDEHFKSVEINRKKEIKRLKTKIKLLEKAQI